MSFVFLFLCHLFQFLLTRTGCKVRRRASVLVTLSVVWWRREAPQGGAESDGCGPPDEAACRGVAMSAHGPLTRGAVPRCVKGRRGVLVSALVGGVWRESAGRAGAARGLRAERVSMSIPSKA